MKFGSIFKKDAGSMGGLSVPVNEVIDLRKRGLSSDRIVEELKQTGYTLTQIRDAMAQAEIKGNVNAGGSKADLPPLPPEGEGLPSPDELMPSENMPETPGANPAVGTTAFNSAPGQGPLDMPEIPMSGPRHSTESIRGLRMDEEKPATATSVNEEKIESLIEAIVEEKWEDIEAGIMELTDWKEKIASKVDDIERKIKMVEARLIDIDRKASVKTEQYEKTIEEVNIQMGAFERAMRDVVPALISGIKELRDVVIDAKKQKRQEEFPQ